MVRTFEISDVEKSLALCSPCTVEGLKLDFQTLGIFLTKLAFLAGKVHFSDPTHRIKTKVSICDCS